MVSHDTITELYTFRQKGIAMPLICKQLCLILLLIPPAALAAEPPAMCETPLGVPCYSIRTEWSQWIFFKKGTTDIDHQTGQFVNALRSDGSTYANAIMTGNQAVSLYLAPTDKVVKIFSLDATYSSREPLIWHDRPYRRSKTGDGTCSTGILHYGTDFHLDPRSSEMLGLRVVHWNRPSANGGYEDIYMAPDVDCVPLKHTTVHHNTWHVPTFVRTEEATHVEWQDPSSTLFTIPATYREIEDPALPGLRRFLTAQNR
jgi:hypothetical protein